MSEGEAFEYVRAIIVAREGAEIPARGTTPVRAATNGMTSEDLDRFLDLANEAVRARNLPRALHWLASAVDLVRPSRSGLG